jgi:hypothetical protein
MIRAALRPRPGTVLRPKPKRLREKRPHMTVVLGTLCKDGLVIAADREVSGEGEVKFYDKKLFTFHTTNTDVVLGYAGIRDVMKGIEEDLRNRLEGQNKSSADIEIDLRQSLEKAISKNEKSPFWTLCAIFLEPSIHLPLYRAVPICNYMVDQAKKYVLGCGGLTDLSVIGTSGKAHEQFSSVFTDNVCEMVEITLNAILTSTTEPDITPEKLETLIHTLRDVLGSSLKAFPALLS